MRRVAPISPAPGDVQGVPHVPDDPLKRADLTVSLPLLPLPPLRPLALLALLPTLLLVGGAGGTALPVPLRLREGSPRGGGRGACWG
eukprot:1193167-Prorocentrum_minimum.AAC.1